MLISTENTFDDQPPKLGGLSSRWLLNAISLTLSLVVALVGIQIFAPGGYAGLARRLFPPPAYHGAAVFAITPSDQLVALRATNGQPIWQHDFGDSSQPWHLFDAHDGVLYFATDTAVQALDAQTGKVRWHYDLTQNRTQTASVLQTQAGMLFITSESGPLPAGAQTISALDENTGALRWQTPLPQPVNITEGYQESIRIFAQGIYFILNEGVENSANTIIAIDPLTGALLWHTSLPATVQDHPIALDARDGIVAVRIDDALLAFDNTTGTQIWRVPMQGIPHAGDPILTCIIDQGNVYSINLNPQPGSKNVLVALTTGTGGEQWRVDLAPAPNWTYRLQIVNDTSLAVRFPSGAGGEIHSLATGTKQWDFTGSLANGDQNTILIWDATGIQAHNSADGTLRWHLNANDISPNSFYQTGTMMYLSNGARLRALDPNTGKVYWNVPQSISEIIFATN